MRKKTFFKLIFVSLVSAVGGAGMFLGFVTYVIPRLVVLVPEPNINLSDIGCPSGTYEDMNRSRCSISTQSKAALAYVLEGSGVGIPPGIPPGIPSGAPPGILALASS